MVGWWDGRGVLGIGYWVLGAGCQVLGVNHSEYLMHEDIPNHLPKPATRNPIPRNPIPATRYLIPETQYLKPYTLPLPHPPTPPPPTMPLSPLDLGLNTLQDLTGNWVRSGLTALGIFYGG